jgi:preprotein translocase subunit SecE
MEISMNKAINFLKQSVGELRKSTWLSRQEVVQSTILVAIVVALVSAYVSVIDFGLTEVLGFVVGGR